MKTKKNTKFDYTTIKTFEDACKKMNIDPLTVPKFPWLPKELESFMITVYRLVIIFAAINDGWIPDMGNYDQFKYYPWFGVSSSGFGFSLSYYGYSSAPAGVGFRLCTDNRDKALYIARQFEAEYKAYLLNV